MDLMARYPDKHFDLAVVDPPYGIGNFNMSNHPNQKEKIKWEYDWNNTIPTKSYFNELNRVSKNQVIWGANYYNCFSSGGALVWFKDVRHPNMSKCEIASVSMFRKVDYVRMDWSNTDKFNALRGTDIHPCQKPVKLYEWIFKNYAEQGQSILDTHLGSGSIAIAAHNYGMRLTGCELDREYYDAAHKRFKTVTSQATMQFPTSEPY